MATQLARDAVCLEVEDGNGSLGSSRGQQVTLAAEAQAYSRARASQPGDEGFGDILGENKGIDEGEVHLKMV